MTYNELLSNPKFELVASVEHSDIKSFLANEAEKQPLWTRVANMYQITGLLAFLLVTFKAFMPFFVKHESIFLYWLFAGLIFTFTFLILLHELIHAGAYIVVGAKNLSFGMKFRKFIFYVQSDKQVLNYKQYQLVALAPAVIVALCSIIGMVIFYNQPVFYFFLPIFSFHSVFCSGDFALLSFFANRPHQNIVTVDVKSENKTYFYSLTQ